MIMFENTGAITHQKNTGAISNITLDYMRLKNICSSFSLTVSAGMYLVEGASCVSNEFVLDKYSFLVIRSRYTQIQRSGLL